MNQKEKQGAPSSSGLTTFRMESGWNLFTTDDFGIHIKNARWSRYEIPWRALTDVGFDYVPTNSANTVYRLKVQVVVGGEDRVSAVPDGARRDWINVWATDVITPDPSISGEHGDEDGVNLVQIRRRILADRDAVLGSSPQTAGEVEVGGVARVLWNQVRTRRALELAFLVLLIGAVLAMTLLTAADIVTGGWLREHIGFWDELMQ